MAIVATKSSQVRVLIIPVLLIGNICWAFQHDLLYWRHEENGAHYDYFTLYVFNGRS
jgi:hypothetical protein